MTVAESMLRQGLIDDADFVALEARFAGKYKPLIRSDTPCISATLPVTLTAEGGDAYGPYHTGSGTGAA
jgi:hypothetical protein